MAIKRLDPTARFKIICVFDDALDLESQEELDAMGKDDRTRYQQYMENFDESKLKFKEGLSPTRFHVRCLKASEVAELNARYQKVDVVKKTIEIVNRSQMMIEIFNLGVIGIEDEEGKVSKIGADELEASVVIEIGSMISLLTTLGKNLKKQ